MKFEKIKKHLEKFSVGITGAGGLGSNCAVALTRCGVGTIIISDFDIVDESNLNRQYYFRDQLGMSKTEALKETLLRINPQINIVAYNVVLNSNNIPRIFSGCDVIVEAFDKPDMKEMLTETVQTLMPSTPLVIGSGLAGWGNNNLIKSRCIDDSLYICGDESSEISENAPAMAPRVGIVANMQANIVIDILMNKL
jgi:sulfur carrier protein ThiS adenylyltransferase